MKRTGEVILGIVGAVIYAGITLIGIVMTAVGNEEVREDITTEMLKEDSSLSKADINDTLDTASSLGMPLIVVSLLAIIAGIVAMVLLRGNKNPKVSGIIFIATGVVVTVIIGFFSPGAIVFTFLPGLFFVIAGIVALARKPPQTIDA